MNGKPGDTLIYLYASGEAYMPMAWTDLRGDLASTKQTDT